MPRAKTFDTILKVRIDTETYNQLKVMAKNKKIPLSVLIRRLINAELRKYRQNSTISRR